MEHKNQTKLWQLQSMGIQTYEERSLGAEMPEIATPITWPELQKQVQACTKCPLHESRTQAVFGVGSETADLVFVGEAPGQQEDLNGEPFVGRAGQLLDRMLLAIGLKREQIYIANILKCRPPNNRDPKPEEQACCTPYLQQQLHLLKPKVIVALGRISAQYLLKSTMPLSRLRGEQHGYGEENTPLLVTYHPAYLLRRPGDKAKAWEDLLKIKNML